MEKTEEVPLYHKYPKLYKCWDNIKQRCLNPNNPAYQYYGARGIGICKRWRLFKYFVIDVPPSPSPNHVLHRQDNSKGYEPGNVIWVSSQAEHMREHSKNWKWC